MAGANSISIDELVAALSGDGAEAAFISLKDIFQYQGYDPKAFVALLWGHAQKAGRTKEQFLSDMQKVCIIVLLRGTNWTSTKFGSKTDQKGMVEINQIIQWYKIVKNSNNATAKKEDVFVSRIAGCFPWVIAGLLARGFGRIVGKIPEGCPRFYCFPGAASIIPKTDDAMFNRYIMWAKSFDEVINKSTPTDNARLQQISSAAWNSSWIGEPTRQSWFTAFNTIASNKGTKNTEESKV